MFSIAGKEDTQGKFDWSDACLDSAIVGGIAFATTFIANFSFDPVTISKAGIQGVLAFLSFMALKRGIRVDASGSPSKD